MDKEQERTGAPGIQKYNYMNGFLRHLFFSDVTV